MNESVKQAQENAYKLWGEHVSTDIYYIRTNTLQDMFLQTEGRLKPF